VNPSETVVGGTAPGNMLATTTVVSGAVKGLIFPFNTPSGIGVTFTLLCLGHPGAVSLTVEQPIPTDSHVGRWAPARLSLSGGALRASPW
jgi:hypothetical protein